MALWNWDPFREIDALHRDIDRAFRGLGSGPLPFFRAAFLPGRAARHYPMINLSEDYEAFYVEALAPGVAPGSLDVTVVHNSLTISGEKRPTASEVSPEAFHRCERAAGRFVRTIDLPGEVDEGQVAADYKNGLLVIRLPKTEKAKPKQISVKIS